MKTTKAQTRPIRHGRARDTKILPDKRRVPLSHSLSLLIHQVTIESSCGDRVYLTYGGPTFGIIYGPKSFNAPKRTSSLCPPPSLSRCLLSWLLCLIFVHRIAKPRFLCHFVETRDAKNMLDVSNSSMDRFFVVFLHCWTV